MMMLRSPRFVMFMDPTFQGPVPRVKKIPGNGKSTKMNESLSSNVKRYKDYRELLAQKDIDAVCISTPDHWHALQTIHAFEAGKHVYVEKPLTITIKEGREMINAQKIR